MVLILESMQEFVFKDLRVVTNKYIASGSSIYIYILHCHGNVPNYLLFWIVHKHVAVHEHGPFSLYTKLEGPSIPKLDFDFPQYDLCMMFKSP